MLSWLSLFTQPASPARGMVGNGEDGPSSSTSPSNPPSRTSSALVSKSHWVDITIKATLAGNSHVLV